MKNGPTRTFCDSLPLRVSKEAELPHHQLSSRKRGQRSEVDTTFGVMTNGGKSEVQVYAFQRWHSDQQLICLFFPLGSLNESGALIGLKANVTWQRSAN